MTLYSRIRPADISQLFYGTTFMYGSNYVFCRKVAGETLFIRELSSGETYDVKFDPELCKPISARLGMVNTEACAYFVSRRPVRQYSLGISSSNTRITSIAGGFSRDEGAVVRCYYKGLVDTFNNVYPSFDEALAKVKAGLVSVAFDKQFAIDYNMRIYYRRDVVGIYRDGKVVFNQGKKYLQEVMNG